MHRLFVALRPLEPIRDLLSDAMEGVPDARWQDHEQLHLTLRFLGEVDRAQAEDLGLVLSRMVAPAVTVRIDGVGSFGSGGVPTSLWAGVAPHAGLAALHAKVDRALAVAGMAPDSRAYLPHITVGRLSRTSGRHPSVTAWLARNAALASSPFTLDELTLYESRLDRGGARYEAVAAWPLTG